MFQSASGDVPSYLKFVRRLVERHAVHLTKETLQRLGSPAVKVGLNSSPTFGSGEEFWASLGSQGGRTFLDALDYVGLDFFPDVFRRPTARRATSGTLSSPYLGRCGGNGLPRPALIPMYQSMSRRTIGLQEMFDLRDSDSSKQEVEGDFFYHFGLTHDDYSPNDAYATFRRLIREMGTR
jgi:hypothetical protein